MEGVAGSGAMIVLVTGATGFVGREVVRALCSLGLDVRGLVRTPGRERVLEGQRVDVHYGNVKDPAALKAAFYDVDVVVHLVAVIRERGATTFDSVNRLATQSVLEAAKHEAVKYFVHVSAIGAADDPRYPYLHSKWKAEQAVIESGIPYTIVRPSIMFGAGDEFMNPLAALVRLFPGVPLAGSGRNRFQPISVEEVARCTAEVVVREDVKNTIIEIGGPDHLSYNDIVDVIAHTLQKRRMKVHIPVMLMRPVVKLMEALLSTPPVTSQQLRMLPVPNITQLDNVEKQFGFKPRPLQGNIEYIKDMTTWEGVRILMGSMPTRIRDH